MSNNCRGGPPWPPVRLIHNPDVGLSAWIDFKMICKLTTKPGDFDRLSRAEAAHVDARRRTDEDVDFTRAVVDNDDESKRQIVDDWLRDRSRDANYLAFGPFTHVASIDG